MLKEMKREEEEECSTLVSSTSDISDLSYLSHIGEVTHLSRPSLTCPAPLHLSHLHILLSPCAGSAGWSADSILSSTVNSSAADITLQPATTHNASASPGRRPRRTSSPLVYSILVEDKQVLLIVLLIIRVCVLIVISRVLFLFSPV